MNHPKGQDILGCFLTRGWCSPICYVHWKKFVFHERQSAVDENDHMVINTRFQIVPDREARCQEMLAGFDFTVVHRPEKQYLNADAFLRIPTREPHSYIVCEDLDLNALSVTTSAVNCADPQPSDPDAVSSTTGSHKAVFYL
ncbi:unnamed protein product [Dibothriocephalus latus]|uniref:Uncharacterized protein n=1 Tax=Dibothriocephalus latus TaxID=60516 RepID=A0A3P7MXE7_DIBLA|nr:unnamed protein product [Dibothriocephalus latus]